MQQILTLTEAEWQEMAASHNILLKQTQTTILMNEQKVNQERSERLPSISIIAADHLDGPFIQALRDTELLFRGSSNQRIIYLHGNPDDEIIPGTVPTIPLK